MKTATKHKVHPVINTLHSCRASNIVLIFNSSATEFQTKASDLFYKLIS